MFGFHSRQLENSLNWQSFEWNRMRGLPLAVYLFFLAHVHIRVRSGQGKLEKWGQIRNCFPVIRKSGIFHQLSGKVRELEHSWVENQNSAHNQFFFELSRKNKQTDIMIVRWWLRSVVVTGCLLTYCACVLAVQLMHEPYCPQRVCRLAVWLCFGLPGAGGSDLAGISDARR